jgi:hypothetical protein
MNRRTLLVNGIAGIAGGIAVLSAPVFHEWGTLDATVSIINSSDPLGVKRVSGLQIEVTNTASRSFAPVFTSIREDLQTRFYWKREQGPQVLASSETAAYAIVAPSRGAAIPYSSRFLVGVQDPDSGHTVTVGPQQITSPRSEVITSADHPE